ncbi:MAG: hypothetical protein K9L98_02265 [Candidatus Pacebacteria bacterium]|nr:hypothetical protein [Candidatus Paceibacterota bacterium]MCF7862811.1 hypothetical protein [Candidatus Paceibacterota bacterium]
MKITIREIPNPKKEPDLKESITTYFKINGHKIPFTHQETTANCGPLALVNGAKTLQSVSKEFFMPKDFPITAKGIRELFILKPSLKKQIWGTHSDETIVSDSFPLLTTHVDNLLRMLCQGSNLKIIGDRFHVNNTSEVMKMGQTDKSIDQADWLFCHKSMGKIGHYVSFVRINKNEWVLLDSLMKEPLVVNQNHIKNEYRDTKQSFPLFVALKVSLKVEASPIIITRTK